jgi:hypothetical protein
MPNRWDNTNQALKDLPSHPRAILYLEIVSGQGTWISSKSSSIVVIVPFIFSPSGSCGSGCCVIAISAVVSSVGIREREKRVRGSNSAGFGATPAICRLTTSRCWAEKLSLTERWRPSMVRQVASSKVWSFEAASTATMSRHYTNSRAGPRFKMPKLASAPYPGVAGEIFSSTIGK